MLPFHLEKSETASLWSHGGEENSFLAPEEGQTPVQLYQSSQAVS